MASQISVCGYHSGQMLWARTNKDPYWPSIVCPSDSGQIVDDASQQSVHVRLCASSVNKRNRYWVKLENVFEFEGYESFLAKKRSMKTKLSENDFIKAFDAVNDEGWRSALVKATYIMNKDVDSRLDALNMLEDINCELSKIASSITFEDTTTKPQKQTGIEVLENAIPPKASNKSLQKGRRRSEPVLVTKQLEPQPTRPAKKVTFKVQDQEFKELKKPILTKVPSKSLQKGRRRSEPVLVTKQSENLRRQLDANEFPNKKPDAFDEFEKDLITYGIESYPKKQLFQGVRQGYICKICCSTDVSNDHNLVKCSACGDHVHSLCLTNNNDESYVKIPEQLETEQRRSTIRIRMEIKLFCNECPSSSICYVCKEVTAMQLEQCSARACGRSYHFNCLKSWKQTEFVDSKLKCPLHVCHTCFSSNKDRATTTTKFTFCVKCPTTYHIDSWCIPAGTIILTQNQHICIRHRRESRRTLPSLDWCYRCGEEDDALLCCGSCPKTYHMSCLSSAEFSDPFLCEICSRGQNPLYGETVLAKYENHPWWPAVIVPPFKIPKHMYDDPPKDHEFCIRFFGDYSFGWTGRSSVYAYSKNEASKFFAGDPRQNDAFVAAANWFDKIRKVRTINLEENQTQQQSRQVPAKYSKITNVIPVASARLIKSRDEPEKCSCSADDDDPCGPTSNCENRQMSIECEAECCPTGRNCKNQFFQRKIFPSVKVAFVDEKKGFGLFADEFIFAGTLVIEYVGELITEDEHQRRQKIKRRQSGTPHYYFMAYSKGLYIDADKKGNESRFANHSCEPNCETQKWTVKKVDRIGYVALKDIEKGTEITTNYDFSRDDERHLCFCGSNKCKNVIGS